MKKIPTIGLSMIVKNEAHVIERCLDSLYVEDLLDYYFIVDTGSTDGTQDVIRNYFSDKGIQGMVVDYPFTDDDDRANHTEIRGIVDFRNMALEGLVGKTDYIFWIDADEEVEYADDFSFNEMRSQIVDYDYAYFRCNAKGFQFRNNHLIKTSVGWEWHGIAHEYLRAKAGDEATAELHWTTIEGCNFIYNEDGNSWRDMSGKVAKYVKLLTKQHEEEPTAGRWLFYLGQSYRAMNTKEGKLEAIKCYEKRADLFSGTHTDAEAYASKLLALVLRQELGEHVTVKDFESCGLYDMYRIEHMMYINQLLWQYKTYESAYKNSAIAYKKFMKPPLGHSELGIKMEDYTFSCAHIHAINCFYTKKKLEGINVLYNLVESIRKGNSPSLVSKEELDRLKQALNAL